MQEMQKTRNCSPGKECGNENGERNLAGFSKL